MADLSQADAAAPTGFAPAVSTTGALELRWPPFAAAELHVWVLLTDPALLSPADLRPDVLLRELIRVPVDADAGSATVHVPVDRPLGVLLMARDHEGRARPSPPFTVRSGAPVARRAEQGAAPVPAAQADAKAIPLVFARGREPLPDLAGMARRIAARLGASPAPQSPIPAVARAAPVGFGARQRWTLTRLGFAPARAEGERVLILRPTFIDAASIASWQAAPPSDASELPAGADGLVDALTEDEAMAFYVVLERSQEGWRPIELTLLNPPFDGSRAPFVVGDATCRLAPLASQPATSDAHASLIAAALRIVRP